MELARKRYGPDPSINIAVHYQKDNSCAKTVNIRERILKEIVNRSSNLEAIQQTVTFAL